MAAIYGTSAPGNTPRSYPALELALRIGNTLLSAGMTAREVVVRMLRITRTYGLPQVNVDVTYTSITVSHEPHRLSP